MLIFEDNNSLGILGNRFFCKVMIGFFTSSCNLVTSAMVKNTNNTNNAKDVKNTKITLKVCCGMNCLAHGGQEILDSVEDESRFTNLVEIEAVECRDTCGDGGYQSPVIQLNGRIYPKMTVERLWELLDKEIDNLS